MLDRENLLNIKGLKFLKMHVVGKKVWFQNNLHQNKCISYLLVYSPREAKVSNQVSQVVGRDSLDQHCFPMAMLRRKLESGARPAIRCGI